MARWTLARCPPNAKAESGATVSHLSVELVIGVGAIAHVEVPAAGRIGPTALPVLRDEEAVRAGRTCAVG